MSAVAETSTAQHRATIPWLLICLRALLGPLLLIALNRPAALAAILVTAMLSDIFDGVIARRLKVVTTKLRVADSWVDAWFFICVGTACWLADDKIIRAYALPLIAELLLQIASYTFDLIRYRRIATLHAYSAKAWGASLYAAAIGLLVFHSGVMIWVCFAFGLISAIDALAIKLILPGWRHDVPSSIHAWTSRHL